jgi:predicted transcriptional regulator
MARPKSPALTDGELRIMRVLWDRGRATVGEVVEAMAESPKPAYNTVLTMLRILEDKNHVRHEKVGRAFAFVPLVGRAEARRSALSHLLSRFFDNSPEALVVNLLEHESLDAAELERVRALIEREPESRPAPRRSTRR